MQTETAEQTEITDEQIEALRTEAGAAGDEAQVDLCARALAGDEAARAKCVAAIRYARAQVAGRSYAAIDKGTLSGAVYGIGPTPEAAITDARRGSRDAESTYDTAPISAEAAAYVESHGGEPSPRLEVSRRGVTLAE